MNDPVTFIQTSHKKFKMTTRFRHHPQYVPPELSSVFIYYNSLLFLARCSGVGGRYFYEIFTARRRLVLKIYILHAGGEKGFYATTTATRFTSRWTGNLFAHLVFNGTRERFSSRETVPSRQRIKNKEEKTAPERSKQKTKRLRDVIPILTGL